LKPEFKEIFQFVTDTDEALFLFDETIAEYLAQIYKRAIRLRTIEYVRSQAASRRGRLLGKRTGHARGVVLGAVRGDSDPFYSVSTSGIDAARERAQAELLAPLTVGVSSSGGTGTPWTDSTERAKLMCTSIVILGPENPLAVRMR
jgi:hypothetical protein